MNVPPLDCLCAGIVVADHVCAPVAHLPAAGELVTTDRLELTVGGCAANVAADLARLGVRSGIAGRVGDDVFGKFVRESLQDAGVDCGGLAVSASAQTSGTLVVNVRGEDRRFIHTVGANAEFTGQGVTPERLQGCRVLYLGGYCLSQNPEPSAVAELFRMAREANVLTVLDVVIPGPGNYWDRLAAVLPLTDVFLPNDDEARAITGLADPVEQAARFQDAGAGQVVVTCGGRGAVLAAGNKRWRSGTFPVDFVDGTGSGDAFVAGYIHGLVRGEDLTTCLILGSALGASCVRSTGATTGVFTRPELDAFVREHRLDVAEF